MLSSQQDNHVRLSWSELQETALKEPGTIHEAYTRFWNYSIGNQILALMQCRSRGLEPGPIASFQKWKELGRQVRQSAGGVQRVQLHGGRRNWSAYYNPRALLSAAPTAAYATC